ncbi:SDR family NAD(P)-dependent oxidoreductase [Bordetella petrii]|uniref:SDR family NAD(P)-dependent oxidoreductase n=1 Tax=Bordetella petrii TaxID=94624 RepID=UPI001A95CC03|nr:SDR family NAD(P)-dependent oxidoreductase [Bordetella petrii]MBO1114190.1 SDR family oxidoreductase [Bordetella petrii]
MGGASEDQGGIVAVTGAASGIGLALAQGLLDQGRRVLALDVQPERIEAARTSLRAGSAGQLRLGTLDVTDEARVEQVVADCEAGFGPVSGLVNSAGIAAEVACLDTDVSTFRRILDVNVIGSFITARAVARRMRARGAGSIVHIASVSGLRGNYGRVAYGSSKGAIVTMTQVMAVEFAKFGVRVNAVAPGPIETPLTRAVHSEATRDSWRRAVALGRYGQARELCGTINWLLDDTASGYVTGQIIAVDGGFTAMGLAVPETGRQAPPS